MQYQESNEWCWIAVTTSISATIISISVVVCVLAIVMIVALPSFITDVLSFRSV